MSIAASISELLMILAIGLVIPGPNALTSFAHSGLFGNKSNISLIAGMAIGLIMMEVFIGLTVESLRDINNGFIFLHWVGMLFLLSICIGMFRIDISSISSSDTPVRLGLKSGIVMQFFNGKEWAFLIMIMSQFIEPFGGGLFGITIIIIITLLVCIPAMIAWTIAGDKLSNYFADPVFGKRIFKICGGLLFLLWVVFFIRGPMN